MCAGRRQQSCAAREIANSAPLGVARSRKLALIDGVESSPLENRTAVGSAEGCNGMSRPPRLLAGLQLVFPNLLAYVASLCRRATHRLHARHPTLGMVHRQSLTRLLL